MGVITGVGRGIGRGVQGVGKGIGATVSKIAPLGQIAGVENHSERDTGNEHREAERAEQILPTGSKEVPLDELDEVDQFLAEEGLATAHKHESNGDDDDDLTALFKRVDADGNGKISKDEAVEYIQSKGVDLSPVQLDMLWKQIDTDGNHAVDIDEFPIFMDVLKGLEQGLTMGHALRVLSSQKSVQKIGVG